MLDTFSRILPLLILLSNSVETAYAQQKVNIKIPHSGKCLDVAAAGTHNGAIIQQWDCNGTKAQEFTISNVGTITPPPTVTPPPIVTPPPVVTPSTSKEVAVYLQSWSCHWTAQSSQHCLATIPNYVNTILIAFAKPDSSYVKGSKSFSSAGIDFWADYDVVAGAVKLAQAKGQKVLLSVGGATFHGWNNLNAQSLKAVVDDLGLDGLDIDWEGDQVCAWGTGGTTCPKDSELTGVINTLRTTFPSPKLLTAAVWSTGAFGQAPYEASKFKGNLIGGNFGSFINPLKAAGAKLDKIYLMSYDAGSITQPAGSPTGYNPKQAYEAYRAIYKGPIVIGIEGGTQAWGSHVTSVSEAEDLARFSGSAFFWSWQKAGTLPLIQAACRALGKTGCEQAMPASAAMVPEGKMRSSKGDHHMTVELQKLK